MRKEGIVTRLELDRGFGEITGNDGVVYHVNLDKISETLCEGDEVSFKSLLPMAVAIKVTTPIEQRGTIYKAAYESRKQEAGN